ncbi:hypothetical protein L1D55_25830 [Vibrio sp. Isolate22]|uniref:hypothetical protein n=1 Tax=Vibrio TaxID=662 RepID=UPI001EFE669D|nr:hypothetical protein [Vibrio sp. Isolate22]MCG9695082.1 hypothetical protein [Vibrio sp. Isolate22]
MKETVQNKLDLNESEHGDPNPVINKLEITAQEVNTQDERLKALNELSELDQEMGRYN